MKARAALARRAAARAVGLGQVRPRAAPDRGRRPAVADDQTHLAKNGRALIATPPPALAGMIEVRGVGIVKLPRTQLLARGAGGPAGRSRARRRGSSACPSRARDAAGGRAAAARPRAVRGLSCCKVASCLGANRGRMIVPIAAMPDSPTSSASPRRRHGASPVRAGHRPVRRRPRRRRCARWRISATSRSTTCRCRCSAT